MPFSYTFSGDNPGLIAAGSLIRCSKCRMCPVFTVGILVRYAIQEESVIVVDMFAVHRKTNLWQWYVRISLQSRTIGTFFFQAQAPDASEVPIGCIFVHDGIIVAKARNRTNECMRVSRTCSNTGIETTSFIGYSARGARDRFTLNKLWSRPCLYVTVDRHIMCGSALWQLGIKSSTGPPTTDLEDVRVSGDERVRCRMYHPELGLCLS